MIVEFFKNKGGGSPKHSVNYLMKGEGRAVEPKILKGDPDLSRSIAESLSFKTPYTVGCLSFEEPDIKEELKHEIMERFESAMFAGLEPEQYNVLWVEHRDKGRLELNFFIPNIELTTGKRLQPYYDPVDRHLTDSFKKVINHEYGFTNPDSIEKKRALKLDKRTPKNVNEIKKEITGYFIKKISEGQIKERKQIEELLTNAGYEVARATNKSISIKNPFGTRNIRLSGEIFEREFYENIRNVKQAGQSVAGARRRAIEAEREESEGNYRRALEKLGRTVEARKERFKKLYFKQNNMELSSHSSRHRISATLDGGDLSSEEERKLADDYRKIIRECREARSLERNRGDRDYRRVSGLSFDNDKRKRSEGGAGDRGLQKRDNDTEKKGIKGFFSELQRRIKKTLSRANAQIIGIRRHLRESKEREHQITRVEQQINESIRIAQESIGRAGEYQQKIRATERTIKRNSRAKKTVLRL